MILIVTCQLCSKSQKFDLREQFFALLNALHMCGHVHLHASLERACYVNRRILFQLINRSLFLSLIAI